MYVMVLWSVRLQKHVILIDYLTANYAAESQAKTSFSVLEIARGWNYMKFLWDMLRQEIMHYLSLSNLLARA